MDTVYNFSAGPAMLPKEVMEQAQAEFCDWNNSGMSVMEISHRSKPFIELADHIEKNLRELLNIPDNYQVLFLPGGARSQFSMVPMNLLNGAKKAAYIQTGLWGKIAAEEAKRYATVDFIVDTEATAFTTIPAAKDWKDIDDVAYCHYVDNETVNGVEFSDVPEVGVVPLVSDMSSNILSRPVDIKKYGLIYACAQKNLGASGITLVILRDDLLERTPIAETPSMFRYQNHVDQRSMYNTPPTYPWYLTGLVIDWVKQQGGLAAMEERNQRKAKKLYDYIDQSDFYHNPIDPDVRSRMNVPFTLSDTVLEPKFIAQAKEAGIEGIKGHRFVGGMRASIYNAMPEAGVDCLINFMRDFEKAA